MTAPRDFLIALPALCAVLAAGEPVELTILYTGDTFAALYPCDCPAAPHGGIARRATKIRQLRAAARGPVLLLDAGNAAPGGLRDALMAGEELDALREETYLQAMSQMRYDALTLGAQEFGLGREGLLRFARHAPGSLLASNLVAAAGPGHVSSRRPAALLFQTVSLFAAGGLKVAVFSVADARRTPVDGLRTLAPVGTARRDVAEAHRRGADVVICLSSLGEDESARLAQAAIGIDLMIVSGGRRTRRTSLRVGRTILAMTAYQGRSLGMAIAQVRPGSPPAIAVRMIPLSGEIADDPQMAALRERHEEQKRAVQTGTRRLRIDLFLTALDPAAAAMEKILAEAQRALPDRIDVKVRILNRERRNEKRADGAAARRHAAILRFYPDRYFAYARRRREKSAEAWSAAAQACGILPARIRGAIALGEADMALQADAEAALASGVAASPMLFIDANRFGGDARHRPILLAICRRLAASRTRRQAQWPALCARLPGCAQPKDCARAARSANE